mgnify:CR=1 FL=1
MYLAIVVIEWSRDPDDRKDGAADHACNERSPESGRAAHGRAGAAGVPPLEVAAPEPDNKSGNKED